MIPVAGLLLAVASDPRTQESGQMPTQFHAFLDCTADRRQQFPPPPLIRLVLQQLRTAQNDTQQIVDILCHAVQMSGGRGGTMLRLRLSSLAKIHGDAIPRGIDTYIEALAQRAVI